MPEVLESRRLEAVRRVEVEDVPGEYLEALVGHIEARELVVRYTKACSEEASPQQVSAVCATMAANSRLETLSMSGVDFTPVEVDTLARMVLPLKELELRRALLTPRQAEAVMAALDSSSRLKVLRIGGNILNLSSVDPGLLVGKLQTYIRYNEHY